MKTIRNEKNEQQEMPADNGRFGASGGVGSSESEQVTSLFALVQTAVESPACRQAAGTLGESGRQYSRTMK